MHRASPDAVHPPRALTQLALLGWYEQPFRRLGPHATPGRVESLRLSFAGGATLDPRTRALKGVIRDEFSLAAIEGEWTSAGLAFSRLIVARRPYAKLHGAMLLPGAASAELSVQFRFHDALTRTWCQGGYRLQPDEEMDVDWCPGPIAACKLVLLDAAPDEPPRHIEP